MARAISDALIGSVSSCSSAAASADVTSLAVGSTNAAPTATSSTPIVDAFVRACIRDSTSGKRTTPTADSRMRIAPSSVIDLADHSPRPSM